MVWVQYPAGDLLTERTSAQAPMWDMQEGDRPAESLMHAFETLWAWGIGDWELFSQGISAQAPMWDMQEGSRLVLNYRNNLLKPRLKQTNKRKAISTMKFIFLYLFLLLQLSRPTNILIFHMSSLFSVLTLLFLVLSSPTLLGSDASKYLMGDLVCIIHGR